MYLDICVAFLGGDVDGAYVFQCNDGYCFIAARFGNLGRDADGVCIVVYFISMESGRERKERTKIVPTCHIFYKHFALIEKG